MSEVSSSADPVVLAKRRATGEAFSALFREGMALVEMTAAYLDGPGRKEAKGLDRSAASRTSCRAPPRSPMPPNRCASPRD